MYVYMCEGVWSVGPGLDAVFTCLCVYMYVCERVCVCVCVRTASVER